MRISDWSSDVCSSDLRLTGFGLDNKMEFLNFHDSFTDEGSVAIDYDPVEHRWWRIWEDGGTVFWGTSATGLPGTWQVQRSETRSEEHTSELQSLMRISYAVFCLKKKNTQTQNLS